MPLPPRPQGYWDLISFGVNLNPIYKAVFTSYRPQIFSPLNGGISLTPNTIFTKLKLRFSPIVIVEANCDIRS